MAQHRYTPQPPILPREPVEPRGQHPQHQQHHDVEDWGMDEPTSIGMMLPPEAAAVNAEEQRRMASLSSLSLNKGVQAVPVQHAVARSSKLPWVLLTVVLAGGGVYIAKSNNPPAVVAPIDMNKGSATTPGPAPRLNDLVASGYIAAKAPIVLAASTGGVLKELKVDNGDKITKGQVVAVLDDGSVRAELQLANARLRDASRSLQTARGSFAAGAIVQKDLNAAMGAVEIAQGEVRVKTQQLEQTKIKSSINGTVLEVLARPGEALSTSTGVLRIADLTLLVAEADISEAELKTIVVGMPVEVTTDSARDRPYTATVKEISQQADKARGTVLVRSYLEASTDGVLKPGNAVQVKFIREPKPAETPPPPTPGSAAAPAIAPAATITPPATEVTPPADPAVKATEAAKPEEKPAAKPVAKAKARAKAKYVPKKKTPRTKSSGGGLDI